MEKPGGMGEKVVWGKNFKDKLDAEEATREKESPKRKLRKYWSSLSDYCIKELERAGDVDAEYAAEDIMNSVYANLASSNPSIAFSGKEIEKEIRDLLKELVNNETRKYLSNKINPSK